VPLPFRLWLDPELRVMHIDQDCPAAKIARKYHYLETELVDTKERAIILDAKYRACDRCKAKMEAARGPTQAPVRHHRYRRRSS
jgi:hypothetical protein